MPQRTGDEDPASTYLQYRYGISAQEAERRLAEQVILADLQVDWREKASTTYAGTWIEPDGTIVVAAVANAEQLADQARRSGLRSVRSVDRSRSEQAIKTLQQRVGTRLADLPVGISADAQLGVVSVHLPPKQDEAAVSERLDENDRKAVRLTREAAADAAVACTYTNCDPPLRGGVTAASGTTCTTGFNVRSNSNGASFVLTAGHCTAASNTWTSYFADGVGHTLGYSHNSYYPGTDYGLIAVTNPTGWSPGPTLAVWGNQPGLSDNFGYTITGPSGSVLGATICHSGQTSGSDCGTVTELGYTANYGAGPINGLGVVSLNNSCTVPGDSGGPWWAGQKAYGLSSGRGVRNSRCVSYYQGVTAALNALNVSLRTVASP